MGRARPIDEFLALAGAAIVERSIGASRPAGERVVKLLACGPEPGASSATPGRLPVCTHLNDAIAAMRPDLATAFGSLEPQLKWQVRTSPDTDPGFAVGHANARLLGPEGLEQRGGLIAGFSLVAPGVTYPDHHHPPEEIYLVLSGGAWWQFGGSWHEPGPGGIVHNPPGILHAMRGMDVPLLAIWFLLPAKACE